MKNEIEMIIIKALEGANSGFTEIAAREIKKAIKLAQKEGYQQAIDALNERHQSLKQGAFPTPASYLEGFESAQYFLDYKKKEIMK
jgi:streptomycin 6-kinase